MPQLYANLNRTQAKQQNVSRHRHLRRRCRRSSAGYYINDFNYLGRTWHVMAQADSPYRAHAVGRGAAEDAQPPPDSMVPLGTVLDLKDIVGPDRIARYDLYDAAELNGSGRPRA